MQPEVIGWAASALLLVTLSQQIWKQAHADDVRGVSKWLFLGQSLSSLGFVAYSVLVGDWVFIVTNSCILLTAVVGQVVIWRRRRRAGRS